MLVLPPLRHPLRVLPANEGSAARQPRRGARPARGA